MTHSKQALSRLGALWAAAASTLIQLISDTKQLSDVVQFKVIYTQKNELLKTEATYSEIKESERSRTCEQC